MAPHHVTITIHKPEDLFADAADTNPMQPEWEADSGMQRVFDYLKIRRLRYGVRVTIQYPNTLVVPVDGKDKVIAAIHRYCDARITENARERHSTILTGLTGLAYGLVISILLSAFLKLVLEAVVWPDAVEAALIGLSDIAVWAIVWGPLAAIFFDWLPNWTAIRVYRVMARGDYELKPIQLADSTSLFG